MLELLHIENIAIIEFADIMFQKGLNILSGETGAGKSIVIDSLSAVLGERTSRDLIRSGEQKAYVSAIFSDVKENIFTDFGVVPDEQGNLFLEREIQQDGRNVCRVNGRIVTVSQLKNIGNRLLNIHGQHDGQQLLDETQHIIYLDNFGKLNDVLQEYRSLYAEYKDIEHQIRTLEMDESEKERKLDTLHFQIKELSAATLVPGEEEKLKAKKELLKNSEKFVTNLSQTDVLFSGNDNADGILSALKQAMKCVESIENFDDEVKSLSSRLNTAYYEVYDIAESLNSVKNHFDFSNFDLDETETRLDLLYRLKKKYGPSVEDMIDYLNQCQKELDRIELSDDHIVELTKKKDVLHSKALEKAKEISKVRVRTGNILKEQIEKELSELDMPRVRFEVNIQQLDELGVDGLDQVVFLMSANLGEELRPIHKIASGGELARIMLALKNVLSEQDQVQTMVFDEIDTGVSGRAAQKVGTKMSVLSKTRQVLCVTHLPQIAAMADSQFIVKKEERNGRTYTDVKLLSYDERVAEIARLTGGDLRTDGILQGAEELLSQALETKHKLV